MSTKHDSCPECGGQKNAKALWCMDCRRKRGGRLWGDGRKERRWYGRERSGPAYSTPGNEYVHTEEQAEWLKAMDRLRRRLGRRPTWDEVLREAVRIGYCKERNK